MMMSVPMLLSLSVAGLGFVGADIGGFFANEDIYESDSEAAKLMMMWHSLGLFYPFMR
jgi:alpha-glucosidase (family GH31 glycosyl hydrolase)